MAKFEKLEIWKEAIDFGKETFVFTDTLKQRIQFSVGEQLRRASLSISSNIAEGSGSESIKEELRYLNIAINSAYECLSQLYFLEALDKTYNVQTLKIPLVTLIKRMKAYKKAKQNQQ